MMPRLWVEVQLRTMAGDVRIAQVDGDVTQDVQSIEVE